MKNQLLYHMRITVLMIRSYTIHHTYTITVLYADYHTNSNKCTYFRIFEWVDLVLWYFSQSEDAVSITDYGFGSLPKQEHTIWRSDIKLQTLR